MAHSDRSRWRRPSGAARAALAAALVVSCSVAAAESLEDIADPRPGGGCVIDLTGRLRAATLIELNAMCSMVKEQAVGEVVVAVVRSVRPARPRDFGTKLYNRWRIDPQRSRGVLLLVALDDRKAEGILGDGVDSDAEVRVSDEIMANEIVARFKQGDQDGAILRGATAYAERILGARFQGEAEAPEGTAAESAGSETAGPGATSTAEPVAAVPAPVPVSDGSTVISGESSESVKLRWCGSGGVLAALLTLAGRFYLRRRPRRCPRCKQQMERLGEAADDQYLDESQRLEERLGSVDYDVWICQPCNEVIQARYGALFTRYARCPRCSYKTKSSTSQTLQSATYDHGGLVEVHERCEGCDYRRTFTRSTPRLVRSSSSSRGFSSGGGGHSSGRGSSGSW